MHWVGGGVGKQEPRIAITDGIQDGTPYRAWYDLGSDNSAHPAPSPAPSLEERIADGLPDAAPRVSP